MGPHPTWLPAMANQVQVRDTTARPWWHPPVEAEFPPIEVWASARWLSAMPNQTQIPQTFLPTPWKHPALQFDPEPYVSSSQGGDWRGMPVNLLVPPPKPSQRKFEPVPRVLAGDPSRKLWQFTQSVSVMLNSLLAKGFILRTAVPDWKIIGGAITNTRDPGVADDIGAGIDPGMHWINTVSQQCWVCITNTAGAALWKKITS